jgi:hypothetical protein
MACGCDILTGGISKGCTGNQGGVRKVWITDFCNITSFEESSGGEIGTINMTGATLFYEFQFNKNSSTFQEEVSGDQSSGSQINTQTVTLVLARREKSKRDTLQLLMGFKELSIIVLDSNGIYWLLGETNGMVMTTNTSVSGTAAADSNNYTITLIGEEPNLANEVLAAAVLANI